MVGSQRRTGRGTIEATGHGIPVGAVVITGGADGPDLWAEQAARARGLEVVVHEPDLDGVHARWQAAKRFHARNQRIVDDSDLIIRIRGARPHRRDRGHDSARRARGNQSYCDDCR
jgi:hypothetical protein